MKYTRDPALSTTFWKGSKSLPLEINVISYDAGMAEFQLLSILCTLHGYVTAFDLLTGSEAGTEKDTDITSIMTAFQAYLSPKMPLSNYTDTDHRAKPSSGKKGPPIDS
jgi:hypothetical protein